MGKIFMITTNINNLIEEMDNPFASFTKKFDLIQILKTIGFGFIPFALLVSLHNCYKRMFNYPIESKVKGFGALYLSSLVTNFTAIPVLLVAAPMIYLNCLRASRDETAAVTGTVSIFKKFTVIYGQGLSESLQQKLDVLDNDSKFDFKQLSERYKKLSTVEDTALKNQVIKDYSEVVFNGIQKRIQLFKDNSTELTDTQNALVKEIASDLNKAKSEFKKEMAQNKTSQTA